MPTRPIRRIASADNAQFKRLKRLVSARGARKDTSVLVAGGKTIRDLVAARGEMCEAWIGTEDLPGPPEGLPPAAAWYQLASGLFRALDVFGTGAPLLLVRAPVIAAWRPGDGLSDGCTLLVPFQDPENVGAVIRSAAAFDVSAVVLLSECGYPFHPRAVRASGGAVFQVTLYAGPSIHDIPPGLPLVALSGEGVDLAAFRFPGRFALLPGLEGPGVPAALRGAALSIPISPRVESLNAATATAIALYEWARRAAPPFLEPL